MHRPADLPSLTGARYLAAAAVLLIHASQLYPLPGLQPMFVQGGAGVSFFFVLSGFLLAYRHADGVRLLAFYQARFARLYPLYAVALALAALVSPAPAWAILTSLGLVQAWRYAPELAQQLNPPGWSLSAEAFFYAVFPALLCLASRARRPLRLVGLALACETLAFALALAWAGVGTPEGLWTVYSDPLTRVWEFVAGVGLGTAYVRGHTNWWQPWHGWAALCALACVVAAPVGRYDASWLAAMRLYPAYTVPFLALVLSLAHGWARWLACRPMQILGQASYALYLLHWPALLAVRTLCGVSWPALVVALAAAHLAALAGWRAVEGPAQKLFTK